MARNHRPIVCMMIAFLALAGTASAAGSLAGSLTGSVGTEHGSADFGADANGEAGGEGLPTLDGGLGGSASAQDHNVGAHADSDGNVYATADDHEASGYVNIDGRSAGVTVDGQTVSTDELDANLPADVPDVPELHGGTASFSATLSAMASAMGSLVASIAGGFTGLFSW